MVEFDYVTSEYDDDTEGNSFLINREQDLKTVTYLEKTDTSKLEQYNTNYFSDYSLIVFKVIDSKNSPSGIKGCHFKWNKIVIDLNTRPQTIENKTYYFYLIKIKKISSSFYKRIRIFEDGNLFSDNRVQKEDYYDFLRNFDLNINKDALKSAERWSEIFKITGPINRLQIVFKNTQIIRGLNIKLEYFDIETDFKIEENYDVNNNFISYFAFFDYQSNEKTYELMSQFQKVEFVCAVTTGISFPT